MMAVIIPWAAARQRARRLLPLLAALVITLLVPLVGATQPGTGKILFARTTPVPPPVQQFAWYVIETRCTYQSYERDQRWFWAYQARAKKIDAGVSYSIDIVSEVAWRKADPPAIIEMTIVDDGGMRLTALRSSFAVCSF
jgi:hypothetical protein